MSEATRVLIVEDLPSDAELSEREIGKALGQCQFRRVETREEYVTVLEEFRPALIVSDFKMPRFDGLTALGLAKKHAPDVPFIILTGSMNEDTAVECMKAGAWDYVIKEHVKRLGLAIRSAMELKRIRMEHSRAERERDASEIQYRRLFEAAKDGILILDASTGEIIDVNPFLIGLTGYPRGHFLGKRLWEIGLFEDIAASKESFADLMARQYVRYEDLPLATSDGRKVDVEFVSNVYLVGDRSVIQCNIRDISARKQAEKTLLESENKFREYIERTPEGVFMVDETGRYTKANRSACRISGYSEDELMQMSIRDLVADESINPDIPDELARFDTHERRSPA